MPIATGSIPSERTFARKLDPNGELDYTVDWTNILNVDGNSLTITSADATLSSAASTAGVEFIGSPTVSINGTTTTFRLGVASGSEGSVDFDPPGTDYAVKLTMTDSDGQIWELSFKFTVVQQ